MVGGRDEKHRAIAEGIAATAAHVTTHVVDGCGHNVVLERPDALAALLDPDRMTGRMPGRVEVPS